MKKIILGVLILFLLVAGCSQPAAPQPAPQATQQPKWASYVDQEDGIKISHPADWEVVVSKLPEIKTEITSITMGNSIHIYTPDYNGVIQIGGFSFPTLLYSGDTISDKMYEVMADSFHNSSETSVTTYNTSYMFNGNPARHLYLVSHRAGNSITSDVYIVRHNDIYYTLSYMTLDPSAQQYAATATEIMKTFKTVSWETQ